jgi:hypothetical protein
MITLNPSIHLKIYQHNHILYFNLILVKIIIIIIIINIKDTLKKMIKIEFKQPITIKKNTHTHIKLSLPSIVETQSKLPHSPKS